MTTMRDVAQRAGVTAMTVSRVINNSGYVSEGTRRKVESAIAELQYMPNDLARHFRQQQTQTIALMLSDITNPFWSTVIRGVEQTLTAEGLTLILSNADNSPARQAEQIHNLLCKQMDGIILSPTESSARLIQPIQRQKTPLVVIDQQIPGAEVDTVRGDSVEGAYRLTKLLLALGHRRIAALSGPRSTATAVERVAGYRRALTEAGLPPDESLIHYGQFTIESGYQMARQVLGLPQPPTAIFAANNFVALGVSRMLEEMRLRIPEDVSVVTFDWASDYALHPPFFTMAAISGYEMGRQAANLLLRRLTGSSAPVQDMVLPAAITEHRSTAPPI